MLTSVDLVTLLLFMTVFVLWYCGIRRPPYIPPGPAIVIPGLGNIPNIALKKDLLHFFRNMHKQYGDVFSFYIGKQLMIVINGYTAIKEALVKNGAVFSERPSNFFTQRMTNDKGITFSSGEHWRHQRRAVSNVLHELGFGKMSLQGLIVDEAAALVQAFRDKDGRPFDVKEYLQVCTGNVIFQLLASKRFSYEDKLFRQLMINMDENVKLAGYATVAMHCFPFLTSCPGDPLKLGILIKNRDFFYDFLQDLFLEHRSGFDEKHTRDVMDYFHAKMDACDTKGQADVMLEMKETLGELFGAGTETTASTIHWALLYLILKPQLQQQLRDRIDEVIGSSRCPSLSDRKRLPFVEAFILEVMRVKNVAPLSVPHGVPRDVHFRGYKIPKECNIIVNHESVFKDSAIWSEPEKFRLERFLNEDGNVLEPEQFIPFGIGRRICLGQVVARMELFLILTTLIQKFEFKSPDNKDLTKVEGSLGMTYMPQSFCLCAIQLRV